MSGVQILQSKNEIEHACKNVMIEPLFLSTSSARYDESGLDEVYKETKWNAVLDEDGYQHNVVTDRYELVPNKMIKNAIDDMGMEIFKIKQTHPSRFQFWSRLPDHKFTIGNEEAELMMVIQNSYDGSSAFKVNAGLMVLVCQNGLTRTKLSTDNLVAKHTHSLTEGYIINRLEVSLERSQMFVNMYENTQFNNNIVDTKAKFNKLFKYFPNVEDKDGKPKMHQIIRTVDSRYDIESANKDYSTDFSLFMALTNITTYPNNYGISGNQMQLLEKATEEIFYGS